MWPEFIIISLKMSPCERIYESGFRHDKTSFLAGRVAGAAADAVGAQ
jgi:hypothetical protein